MAIDGDEREPRTVRVRHHVGKIGRRPRGHVLTGRVAERVRGGFFLVLSIILALPIPGGNFPPGLSMTVMSLGLLEKDGRMVAIRVVLGVAAIVLVGLIVYWSLHILMELLQRYAF